jgi:hypothetical protein
MRSDPAGRRIMMRTFAALVTRFFGSSTNRPGRDGPSGGVRPPVCPQPRRSGGARYAPFKSEAV